MTTCRIIHADCRDAMREMPENSVDAIVTDSPYGLSNEPDMAEVLRHWLAGNDYAHKSRGFMSAKWDSFVPGPSVWREALRVLKPGGFCMSFFGDRTYDMGVTAMRLAGFEVRCMHVWLHGQGMNKVGYLREDDGETHIREGWGGSLRPMLEPLVMARKPPSEKTLVANVRRWGTGALCIDECRVPTDSRPFRLNVDGTRPYEGAFRQGGLSCGDTKLGRWPPNAQHDGSQIVMDLFPETRTSGNKKPTRQNIGYGSTADRKALPVDHCDDGSAARFYPSFPPDDATPAQYHPKANKRDRAGSRHPTVKPQGLMRWYCRLVTPPGGTVLDPFAGSGSTLQAARDEGFNSIGIEMEAESVADCCRRMGMATPNLQAAE